LRWNHWRDEQAGSLNLLVDLAKADCGNNQRFTLIWTVLSSLIMLTVRLPTTVIAFISGAR
jgi:Mg2+/citrate symporter